jgi:2-iminobutanoate/2-iminopropanoate deaminase
MSLKVIATQKAPAAIGPYSQGISAGSWHFISGQLGLDPATGELVSGDLSGQARQALKNLQQVVEATGCTLNDVAAVDVFLTDMGEFATFNGIYQEFFSEHKPARAVVAVRALPKGACVEIKCIVRG